MVPPNVKDEVEEACTHIKELGLMISPYLVGSMTNMIHYKYIALELSLATFRGIHYSPHGISPHEFASKVKFEEQFLKDIVKQPYYLQSQHKNEFIDIICTSCNILW
jgi:hypothetical protein